MLVNILYKFLLPYLYIFRLVVSPAPKAANQKEKHILPDSLAAIVGEIIFTRFDLEKNLGSIHVKSKYNLLPVLKMSKYA